MEPNQVTERTYKQVNVEVNPENGIISRLEKFENYKHCNKTKYLFFCLSSHLKSQLIELAKKVAARGRNLQMHVVEFHVHTPKRRPTPVAPNNVNPNLMEGTNAGTSSHQQLFSADIHPRVRMIRAARLAAGQSPYGAIPGNTPRYPCPPRNPDLPTIQGTELTPRAFNHLASTTPTSNPSCPCHGHLTNFVENLKILVTKHVEKIQSAHRSCNSGISGQVRQPHPTQSQPQSSPRPSLFPSEASGIDSSLNLEELLCCPVCLEICRPPIFQCVLGHNICSTCKPRVAGVCPICRQNVLGNMRNIGLEAVYNSTKFACAYKQLGCRELVRGDRFQTHISYCPYKYGC